MRSVLHSKTPLAIRTTFQGALNLFKTIDMFLSIKKGPERPHRSLASFGPEPINKNRVLLLPVSAGEILKNYHRISTQRQKGSRQSWHADQPRLSTSMQDAADPSIDWSWHKQTEAS
jgi:hypothetical protein